MGKKKKGENINDMIFKQKGEIVPHEQQCSICTRDATFREGCCGPMCDEHYKSHLVKCEFKTQEKRIDCMLCRAFVFDLESHYKTKHPDIKLNAKSLKEECKFSECPKEMFKCIECNTNICRMHRFIHLKYTNHFVVKYE